MSRDKVWRSRPVSRIWDIWNASSSDARVVYRVRHVCGVRVIDDGGERAVVVEEDDDLLALRRRHHLVELAQRRRVLHLRAHRKQRRKHISARVVTASGRALLRGLGVNRKRSAQDGTHHPRGVPLLVDAGGERGGCPGVRGRGRAHGLDPPANAPCAGGGSEEAVAVQ
jgi:hypothetical protein